MVFHLRIRRNKCHYQRTASDIVGDVSLLIFCDAARSPLFLVQHCEFYGWYGNMNHIPPVVSLIARHPSRNKTPQTAAARKLLMFLCVPMKYQDIFQLFSCSHTVKHSLFLFLSLSLSLSKVLYRSPFLHFCKIIMSSPHSRHARLKCRALFIPPHILYMWHDISGMPSGKFFKFNTIRFQRSKHQKSLLI